MRSLTLAIVVLSSVPCALAAPEDWVSDAKQQIAAKEYEPSRHGEIWSAPNREHGFRVTFDGRGIQLSPRTGDNSWTWGLRLAGETVAATVRVDGARVTYDRGRTLEWYVNGEHGLEQGFTLMAPGRERGEVVIALERSGSLTPVPARDGLSIALIGAAGKKELIYSDLKVTDATGRELPARMEAGPQIRLVFDDTGATYPVTVDPLYKNPATILQSLQNASWFGYSVSTAGDVNGDGYSDVIVGAPLYDNGQDAEGRAFLYLGGPNGVATTAAWTAESDQAQANFGWSVAAAGDVNGDGFADVIVCSPGWNNSTGKVWVYYGQANGLPVLPSWTKDGTQLFGAFGTVAATAGDVNGDGYADIIVGAPSESNGQSLEGRAYVFMGSASGLSTTPAWIAESNQANADFGVSVATAGDVNGDGYDDVIIGADQYDSPEFNEGRAFVYLGGTAGLAATAIWTGESNQAGAQYGASVATAGDVNGDGYADIIVGAPWYDDPSDAEGRVYVYYGGPGGPAVSAAWTKEIDVAGAHFGASVATAGDVTGDGYADVIIGAPQNNGNSGGVYSYAGGPAGLGSTPWFSQVSVSGSFFGFSVGTAGDVDGDGFSDIVVGGYSPVTDGRAFIYRFMADTPLTTPQWTTESNQASADYGQAVASAGDVNGDGFTDVLVGAPDGAGKAYLYLGSAGGLTTSAAWTGVGNGIDTGFGFSLDSAGDVNGDGYADVIVGAPFGPNGGAAHVYYGGPGGLPALPSWTAVAPDPGSYFGISVASAGDVNGDGFSDVIIGAEGAHGNVGAAYVYLGSPTGLSSTPSWAIYGGLPNPNPGSLFGHSVACAGDVNGDGYSDVLVGAPHFGPADSGAAFIYLGSASGLSPYYFFGQSGTFNSEFGNIVSSAGDINGDGYSDILVSINTSDATNTSGVWLGGPNGLTVDASEANVNFLLGAAAGDVDNDGFGDILVLNVGETREIWRGSSSGALTPSGWLVNPGNGPEFGRELASAGDVNGDGFPDVIIGAANYSHPETQEGAAFFYLGNGLASPSSSRVVGPRQVRSNGMTAIGLYGKSDDPAGFHIAANGMSAAGRTRVRLVWEVKPLGTPFNGAGLGSSTLTDTGAPLAPLGSVAHFNAAVSGLNPATAYHWRTRVVNADPFFPRSPWMSGVGNTPTETKLRMPGCHDVDGDGRGAPPDAACAFAAGDCDDANPSVWATPGPTRNLRFTSKTTLAWDVPSDPGAVTVKYDTLRADGPRLFESATCIESNDGTDLTATDSGTPAGGQLFWYLTRAENSCPAVGVGTLGAESSGYERAGKNCP